MIQYLESLPDLRLHLVVPGSDDIRLAHLRHVIKRRRKIAIVRNDKRNGRLDARCALQNCKFRVKWFRVRGSEGEMKVRDPLPVCSVTVSIRVLACPASFSSRVFIYFRFAKVQQLEHHSCREQEHVQFLTPSAIATLMAPLQEAIPKRLKPAELQALMQQTIAVNVSYDQAHSALERLAGQREMAVERNNAHLATWRDQFLLANPGSSVILSSTP